jgi:inner membrane protein
LQIIINYNKEENRMKGKTHVGMGILAFLSIYKIIPGGFTYVGLIIAGFSSALPDVDHPKSIINKYILPFKNKMTKVTIYSCLGIIVLWYDYLFLDEANSKSNWYSPYHDSCIFT